MDRKYHHLSSEERAVIVIEQRKRTSHRQIAQMLGRAPSTIKRELDRNRPLLDDGHRIVYDPTTAAMAYRLRRARCGREAKLVEDTPLYEFVRDRLIQRQWSPQQIAATLRAMHPVDTTQRVSHETIYAVIYAHPRGSLKKDMIAALRQSKPGRGRRRSTLAGKTWVPQELRIVNRPEEIAERKLPGHWEGDFIKGSYNRSAVGTLVERKTRFVVLCKMDGCCAADALAGFTRQMKPLPAFLRQSLTYDRGTEMTCYAKLAERLDLDIWFADPHAPWQRGSNENTNGLLRQYLPKGMDLSSVTQAELNRIAHLLNGRPRMTLDWATPQEALAQEMEIYTKTNFSDRVALDS